MSEIFSGASSNDEQKFIIPENFGGTPRESKKMITLEDGTKVEAPEGVRDLQDYKEYEEERKAREAEAKKAEAEAEARKTATQLAIRIENSIDQKIVKECIESKNYDEIMRRLAGVDSIPMKGDQIKIDQDSRKLEETRRKYGESLEEAMKILEAQWLGEATVKAATAEQAEKKEEDEKPAGEDEESAEDKEKKKEYRKQRQEILDFLYEDVEFLKDSGNYENKKLSGMSLEELQALRDRLAEVQEIRAKKQKSMKLTGIGKDADVKGNAKDAAGQRMKDVLEHGEKKGKMRGEDDKGLKAFEKIRSIARGMWKGQMFRGYYMKKYEQEARSEMEKAGDEYLYTLSPEQTEERKSEQKATIERFMSDYDDMVHEGKEEKHVLKEEDAAYQAAKEEITKFVLGSLGNGKEGEVNLKANIDLIKKNLRDLLKEKHGDKLSIDNIDEILEAAKERFDDYAKIAELTKGSYDKEAAMEHVFEGFEFIHGKATEGARTEAHRDAFDKIMQRYEDSKYASRIVPVAAVAAAASLTAYAAKMSTTKAGKGILMAGAAAGGVATGGLLWMGIAAASAGVMAGAGAAMKERNRVTGDRAQMARDVEMGEDAGETKYEKAMYEKALYGAEKATDLTGNLQEALEAAQKTGGDDERKALLRLLGDVESRTRSGDMDGIGRIAFSKGQVAQERLSLDLARAQAKVWLGKEGVDDIKKYVEAGDLAFKDIKKNSDDKFRTIRGKQMAKIGVKAGLLGGVTTFTMMVGVQEVSALLNSDQYGVLDKLTGTTNNADAQRTALAGALGLEVPGATEVIPVAGMAEAAAEAGGGESRKIMELRGDDDMSPERLAELEAQGYELVDVGYDEAATSAVDMNLQEYMEQSGTQVERVGWETGNQYRAHYTGDAESGFGLRLNVVEETVVVNGQTYNVMDLARDGKILANATMNGDMAGTVISFPAVAEAGNNIVASTVPGSVESIIFDEQGKSLAKYLELVINVGTDENGVMQTIPLTTVVGEGLSSDLLLEGVAEETVSNWIPQYNVFDLRTPEIPVASAASAASEAATTVAGAFGAPLPLYRRQNLTNARQEQAPEQPTEAAGTGQTEEGDSEEAPEGETSAEAGGGGAPEETQSTETTAEGSQPIKPEQAAPENKNETTPPETTTTPESSEGPRVDPKWEALGSRIRGEFGYGILRGDYDELAQGKRDALFGDWWDNLKDDAREAVLKKSFYDTLPEKSALKEWLERTGKLKKEPEGDVAPGEGEQQTT